MSEWTAVFAWNIGMAAALSASALIGAATAAEQYTGVLESANRAIDSLLSVLGSEPRSAARAELAWHAPKPVNGKA